MLLQIAFGNLLFAICDATVYSAFHQDPGFRSPVGLCATSALSTGSHFIVLLLEIFFSVTVLLMLKWHKEVPARIEIPGSVLTWSVGAVVAFAYETKKEIEKKKQRKKKKEKS